MITNDEIRECLEYTEKLSRQLSEESIAGERNACDCAASLEVVVQKVKSHYAGVLGR